MRALENPVAIQAVQQIRKMRGGAQSHLMLGADGNAWIVKFQNNPQHLRVLPNELVATRLAAAIGLTVPPCDVVEVSAWLIENTAELIVDFGQRREPCRPGLHFGSRLVGGLMPGHVADYLPEEQLVQVRNLREFRGALALDKWTCNANGRQALFHRKARERRYSAAFIDQGFCFNAGEWRFVDAPLRGVYARNAVYRDVTGWESFEPWLTRIEEFDAQKAWEIAGTVPPEWYEGQAEILESLVEKLLARRTQVRALITSFRESSRQPFPNWDRPAGAEDSRLFDLPGWPDPVPGRVM
ncbi:MAG TPA: HipA family kinase [Acidobacteriaceae bacterium]|nr:HipA family kinase [Acidobacteriaceae bacterium]